MVEWEVKLIVGKDIPLTDLTYIEGLKQSAFEKYCQTYPTHLTLVAYNNSRTKIEKIEEDVGEVKEIVEGLAKVLAP